MRLVTTLSTREIETCLEVCKSQGLIAGSVYFDIFEGPREPKSKADRANGLKVYEIQLGSCDQEGGPNGHKRYRRNSGRDGALPYGYAATFDEWGWFMAATFRLHPGSVWGGPRHYNGAEGFQEKMREYGKTDFFAEYDPTELKSAVENIGRMGA